jgi:hypothetical protein
MVGVTIPKGTVVHGRAGTEFETVQGVTTGATRGCLLGGCGGVCYYVRWPDGHLTIPCGRGMYQQPDGSYRIA